MKPIDPQLQSVGRDHAELLAQAADPVEAEHGIGQVLPVAVEHQVDNRPKARAIRHQQRGFK
ncbi:MAG: hypothetical protein ACK44O_13795 [Novosphingobium sp.]